MTRETANRAARRELSRLRGLGVVLAVTGAICLGPVNGLDPSGAVASSQTVVGDRLDTRPPTHRAEPGDSAAGRSELAVIVALGTGFVMIAGGKAYRLRRLHQEATGGTP